MALGRYDFDRRNTNGHTGKMDFNKIVEEIKELGALEMRENSGNIQWKRIDQGAGDWATLFTKAQIATSAAKEVVIVPITVANDNLTSTTTINVIDVADDKKTKLLSATYYNATGLAQNGTNSFKITIQNGDNALAKWDTDTDAIPAGKALVLDIDPANPAHNEITDATVKIVFTEKGEATLPAGTFTLLFAPLENVS